MGAAAHAAAGPAFRKHRAVEYEHDRGEVSMPVVGTFSYADEAAKGPAPAAPAPTGPPSRVRMRTPIIVYASRTHSQLTQVRGAAVAPAPDSGPRGEPSAAPPPRRWSGS